MSTTDTYELRPRAAVSAQTREGKGTMTLECVQDSDVSCKGKVESYQSRSGATVSERCDAHQDAYNTRMDALEERLNADYPGYNIPGSSPPAWFDPTYAGERWDDD